MIHKDRIVKTEIDSQRACKWKPFAEKTYRQMKEMGLTKKLNVHGFLISVDAMITHECKIKSPAGIVVFCSTEKGIFVSEYDSMYGAVSKDNFKLYASDFLMSYISDTGNGWGLDNKRTIELNKADKDYIEDRYGLYFNQFVARYARQGSLYNLEPGNQPGNPLYYIFPDDWPSPQIIPCMSDSYSFCLSGVDNMPLEESSEYVFDGVTSQEISLIGYVSNNKSLSSRTTVIEQTVDNSEYRPPVFIQPISKEGKFEYVIPVTGMYYPFENGRRYFATTFYKNEDGVYIHKRLFLYDALTGYIDDEYVLSCILNERSCVCKPSGTYIASNGKTGLKILHLISLSKLTNYTGHEGIPSSQYWEDNPSSRKYRLIIILYDEETKTSTIINSSQFLSILAEKSINLDVIDSYGNVRYDYAYYTISQFFARPNHDYTVPHDTSMFSDSKCGIYSWSRFYGKFKFDKNGISDTEFSIPEYVLRNEGVRPSLYFSGIDFEGNDSYICICERIEEPREVFKIYLGSPFERSGYQNWIEVPVPTVEQGRLLYARPAGYTASLREERITFLGILRYVETVENQEVIKFAPALMNYSDAKIENVWTRLPPVKFDTSDSYKNPPSGWYGTDPPLPPVERACWSISFFGNASETAMMMKYPTHQAAMPQTPCGPYDGYKRGLP
jgi:hypothetical protein